MAANISLEIAYGRDIENMGDNYMSLSKSVGGALSKAATPGAFLVDILPMCMLILLIPQPFALT